MGLLRAWKNAHLERVYAQNLILISQALKENGLTIDNISKISTADNKHSSLAECIIYTNIMIDGDLISFTSPITKSSLKSEYLGISETAEALNLVKLELASDDNHNEFAVNPDLYEILGGYQYYYNDPDGEDSKPVTTIFTKCGYTVSIFGKINEIMEKLDKTTTFNSLPIYSGHYSNHEQRTASEHQRIIRNMTNSGAPLEELTT